MNCRRLIDIKSKILNLLKINRTKCSCELNNFTIRNDFATICQRNRQYNLCGRLLFCEDGSSLDDCRLVSGTRQNSRKNINLYFITIVMGENDTQLLFHYLKLIFFTPLWACIRLTNFLINNSTEYKHNVQNSSYIITYSHE